ncbi:MAG: flavodoxin family protein [bacterium]|jgi:multimeric flavodoxin WrbA
MKVVAFNGSPRARGNTFQALQVIFKELHQEGIETELIQVGGQLIHGCIACYKCLENKDRRCIQKADPINDYIKKMVEADGIILGSPVYFSNVTPEIKALIDRAGMVARVNGDLLKRKVGAAVVSMRRAGATHTFSSLNFFFFIEGMIVPGSTYWNLMQARAPEDFAKDAEGIATMQSLGQNMAWLLKKLTA